MATLRIDNIEIVAEAGTKLIEVARQNGIEIPSLCYDGELPHYTSCLVCIVKDLKTGKFVPSCSVMVEDGMQIDSSGDDVLRLRREALSMLLSEHRAECEAPCRLVCPVGLNIPELNRFISKGEIEKGGGLSFAEMGLPATICSLCPAYCENACRRKMIDHKIAISTLVSNSSEAYNIEKYRVSEPAGKKIAIIGGSASGLIAAHFLSQDGHRCELFEKSGNPGGSIITELANKGVPQKRAEEEITRVLAAGIKINYKVEVDEEYISGNLISRFDTIIIATGRKIELKGAVVSPGFLQVEGDSVILNGKHIFLFVGSEKDNQQFVRKIAYAKRAAQSVSRFLSTGEIRSSPKRFNSVVGKIEEIEKTEWLKECPENIDRYSMPVGKEESAVEAANCLHCDCRASTNCGLRDLCNELNIKNPSSKFTGYPIEKKMDNSNGVIFEHAKCIKCGLCVRVMEKGTNDPSLCFTGRGFMTLVSEPITYGFDDFITSEIGQAIDICPTGALTRK